jgi:hypothetical protein
MVIAETDYRENLAEMDLVDGPAGSTTRTSHLQALVYASIFVDDLSKSFAQFNLVFWR